MSGRLSPLWRLRATLAALLLPPAVFVLSLERITAWVGRRRPASTAPAWDVALAEWVDRVLGFLPPPWRKTCLKRALVLHYLIRRSGGSTTLRVGVRRDAAGALCAHAWLERDGRVYLEPGTEQVESFQVLASFPATAERNS